MSDNSSDASLVSSGTSASWKKDKICLVCGDRALGYNFNAISCESCKAFFRRNAHKTIRGRCQGQCEVTVESRSFCKRCRQRKCFSVGMKKEMIMNSEQKKVRKMKIIRNRLRRSGNLEEDVESDDLDCDSTAVKGEANKTSSENVSSSLSSPEISGPPIGQQDLSLIRLHEEAISKLEPHQKLLMAELENAHETALKIPVKTSQKATPSSATQFFNLAEGSVYRMAKLAKSLNDFMALPKDDQIALLKGAVTEIMMIRSAMYFDAKRKHWDVNALGAGSSTSSQSEQPPVTSPLDQASASSSKQFLDGSSLNKFGEDTKKMFREYLKFVRSLLSVSHGDLTIIKLLTALSLFSSDRPEVHHRDRVQEIQQAYADLLMSYTKHRFPDDPQLFPKILMKLTDMRDITEIHSKMLSKMNVLEVEPLLIEIFDLGQDV